VNSSRSSRVKVRGFSSHRMRGADKSCAASEKCQQEKRKTVNGEDILFAMTSLGFENYGEALKIYLARYREVSFYRVKIWRRLAY